MLNRMVLSIQGGGRLTGLFLVKFLTEPVGLSLPNFTEPDGKTASPTKNNHFCQFPNHMSLPHSSVSTDIKQWLFCIL